MIIHWQSKNAGPTGQIIVKNYNTFISAPLSVVSAEGKKFRGFIVNVNKLGIR